MNSPSPFLEGTNIQFAWDSTSLGWLKTCPRLYQYSMIEGWRSKGEQIHLKFGQLYHHGLETYDRLRSDPDNARNHEDALREVVLDLLTKTWEDGKPWAPDHSAKTRETLIRSVIWYLEQFGESDAAKTIPLANGKPAVELSFKMELEFGPLAPEAQAEEPNKDGTYKNQPYILCGHLDRVVDFLGGTYVIDRKTSSSTIGSAYFDQYSPDNQMSLYSLAAKVIYQTPVKGVIIDAAQIAVGFTRFSRGYTHRTEGQLEEWLTNTKSWLALAEEYASKNFWPMNDKACHHYGGCVFRKVCSQSPEVRQKFLESDFVKQPWNPLEPR